MKGDEVRKKHKQLLNKLHELERKLSSLREICLAKEIKIGKEFKPIPPEILNKWRDLVKQQKAIYDEIRKLYIGLSKTNKEIRK